MRSTPKALFFYMASFLGTGNILLSQTNIADNKNISKYQIDLITEYVAGFPDNTQLSIALIADGNVNYVGIEKVNNKLLTINNRDSVFEIGSITKLFTSTLLAGFIKEKKLNLNDPVENTFPYKLKKM